MDFSFLDLLTGGTLALVSASLSAHFGMRAADRLPGESRLPQCVFCLRPLQLHEYFPLFGWLLRLNTLRLPCPCGKRTGLWPQPLVELTGFFLGFLAAAFVGWSPLLVPLCLGLGLLPAIAMVDMAFGLIPNGMNLALGVLGLASLVLSGGNFFLGLVNAGGLLGIGLLLAIGYSKLRGREMLGLGDVKFLSAAGFWISLPLLPWFLGLSGVFGIVFGLFWRLIGGGKEFPFAPALCLSLTFCIFSQLYLHAFP